MSKAKGDSPRKLVNRIERLRRRARLIYIDTKPSVPDMAELSALEWAIPILENYITEKFGDLPATRLAMYAPDRARIVSELMYRDGLGCYLCGVRMKYKERTIDHVVPLSKGGKDVMENYALCHRECNLLKGNMIVKPGAYVGKV